MYIYEASRDTSVNEVVGSIPTRVTKYLIFLFSRLGTITKNGVEFHHSTRNTSIFSGKETKEVS